MLAALALSFAAWGQKAHDLCVACHDEQVTDFSTHKHFQKGLSCDACHGMSEKHRAASGAAPPDRVAGPDEVPALCGACHVAQLKDYKNSKHAELVFAKSKTRAPGCGTCHGVHQARTLKQINASCARCHTTLPASCKPDVACSTCHSPHTFVAKKK
ncbi:MAG TPA: cytochrome c3 family protein [Bryobacteraceae bacterium]|nr:cytochrome c3 family protein [Bryobacteraceae bacterium]